jgi:hypothetical protein
MTPTPTASHSPHAERPAGPASRPTPAQIASRIAAAVLGGYAFCWGFTALAIVGLYALGMALRDAEQLVSMLALLLYLVAFLWAFTARSALRVWAVLAGGGASMAVAASLLQSVLFS